MLFLLLSLSLLAQSSSAPSTAPPPQPAAAAGQQPSQARPSAETQTYVIGPQDMLKITVFEEPALSGSYRVGGDGSFDYPYINRIEAAGKTQRQLEAEITKKLSAGFVLRPQVTVEMEQFRSRFIFVSGEVRNPNKYPLTGQMTLLEALVAAGYITQSAGAQVLVTRSPEQPPLAGGVRTRSFSLAEVQADGAGANVMLAEGDSIVVPRAEKFYVSGFVKSPGAFAHEPGMTVLQALSLAGGISEKGSSRGIKIKRRVGGKEKTIGVDLSETIQPGDTIIVRQRML